MGDWYEENVEKGVRDVVKHLRDNGVNTVCSCHHDMTIECAFTVDGEIQRIHDLLFNYLHGHGESIDYVLKIEHCVHGGYHVYTTLCIELKRPKVPYPPSLVDQQNQGRSLGG